MQTTDGSGLALGVCLGMKSIGKSCVGKSHAWFDEGGQAIANSLHYPITRLVNRKSRERQGKGNGVAKAAKPKATRNYKA